MMKVEIGPHPSYGLALPPLGADQKRIQVRGYLAKRLKDIKARSMEPRHEQLEKKVEFEKMFNTVTSSLQDLLTDYDREVVLPSTCALSMIKPSHTDLEEKGTLVDSGSDTLYDEAVVKAVGEWYRKFHKDEFVSTKIRLPRGKNTGYPILVGGMSRESNSAALAWHVAVALGAQKKGWTLADLNRFMAQYHGEPFFMYGERYQHTGKYMPLISNMEIKWTKNFEPRVRSIWMPPKYAIAWNKPHANYWVNLYLNTPVHTQDRVELDKGIRGRMDTGNFDGFAIDVSGFDRQHGGKRGTQILRMLTDMAPIGSFDDIATEWDMRGISFYRGNVYESRNRPLLFSGFSHTTAVGCAAGMVAMTQAFCHILSVTPDNFLNNIMGTSVFPYAWGDDLVVLVDKKHNLQMVDIVSAYQVSCKIEVTEEPTLKYLGSNYAKSTFGGSMDLGYSVGRAIQQQFFPERRKEYPFSTIGLIARCDLMGAKGEAFFKAIQDRHWDDELLGEKISWGERHGFIESVADDIEKYAKRISQMDDVLNMLVHGLADHPDVQTGFEVYDDFLGKSSVDLTDPESFLREEGGIPDSLINSVKRVLTGDFSNYAMSVDEFTRFSGLKWNRSDVVY
uniref:RNA-dependent polymerase n=1 Tax=Phineus pisuviri-like virus 1 TaxID=2980096 RepID=A0A977KQ15_9VIRU|nr:MAG: RNA-dependent polymerase [Phineus pisuviri-like virus 1]